MEHFPIRPDDDAGVVFARAAEFAVRLLGEVMPQPVFTRQPEDGVTYAEKITAADRELDLTDPLDAWRRVRALSPHIGAWATLHAMGEQGYVDTARQIMELAGAYRRGIEAIGLDVLGEPDLSILCFTSREVDMLRVGEEMALRAWLPGLVRDPHAMHLMLSMLHAPAREDYLRDLRDAVAQVRRQNGKTATIKVTC